MKKLAIALAFALALSACQTTQTRVLTAVEFQQVDIPSQFLDCDGKKIPLPDPKKLTVKQLNKFILQLVEIIEECQSDTSSVKKVISEFNLEVQKINERSKK